MSNSKNSINPAKRTYVLRLTPAEVEYIASHLSGVDEDSAAFNSIIYKVVTLRYQIRIYQHGIVLGGDQGE